MDQVELAVDPGPLGQLEHEAPLDFDADGFDFQLDGVYDQADDSRQDAPTVTTESAVDQVDEIGYEDDEEDVHLDDAAPNSAETDGPAKDLAGDGIVEAGLEYQEEIGYEEDYSLTTEAVNVDENSRDLNVTDSQQPAYQAEDQLDPQHEDFSDQNQTHGQGDQAVSQGSPESENPIAEEEFHQQLDDDDDDEKENVTELDNHSDMDYDTGSNHAADHEDYLMDHDEEPRTGLSEVDRAIEDLASSLHGVPDVEVFYNDVNYSLFGTSNDDPESYFLSDIKKLDEPLAQFLSSLRQVIANEIAPTDTLLVSFDSLDLEFGERSSERFLKRTLRELLDCHAALAAKDSAIASIPVLQLILQHDCEERFLQLLDEAKYGGESPRHSGSEHSEHDKSEHPEEWPTGELQGDEQDETTHASYENEVSINDVAAGNDESHSPGVSPVAQTGDEFNLETDAENDDTTQNEEAATPSAHSPVPVVAAEGQSTHDNQGVYPETLETMDTEDIQPSDFPQEQASYETVNDHIDEQEMKDVDKEFDTITKLETTEEAYIASNGEPEQTIGPNGKTPFFFHPTNRLLFSNMSPTRLSRLANPEVESVIDYDDGEPLKPESTNDVQHGPMAKSESVSSSSAVDEEYMIDYSDDEDNVDEANATTHPGDAEDSYMSDMASQPNNHFFTSHSRASSQISISFSHYSDANIPHFQDDDLLLAFDQDGGLSTIEEQEGDDGQGGEISTTVVPEVNNALADSSEDALETDWQAEISQVSRGMTPAVSKDPLQEPSAAATGDTASDHTSTTMNGDEIDYDEHDGADDSFTPDNSAPHSVVAPVEDGDEIDWGNDGDEYEEGHDDVEGDITFETQPDLALTPSSPTGKRYRTDDTESLAEESDHKRRRT